MQRRPYTLIALIVAMAHGLPVLWAECNLPASFTHKAASGPTDYLAEGRWFAEHKQFGCATAVFTKAVAAHPDSAEAFALLGSSLSAEQQPAKALVPLQKATQLSPRNPQYRASLAATLDAAGSRKAAEVQWRIVLALDPHNEPALNRLSRDLLADGAYADVIDLLLPLERGLGWTDDLAVDLSVAYTKSGLLQAAADVVERRRASASGSVALAEALSGVLLLQSRFDDAMHVLEPFTTTPQAAQRTKRLYLQVLVLAHDPRAQEFARQLLAQAPGDAEVLYFSGLLRQEAGLGEEAASFFRRSIAASPNSADAHYRLGLVLLSLEQSAAAQQEFQRAEALGLNTPDLHAALGKAFKAEGNSAAAQSQFALYSEQLQADSNRAQAASEAQRADQAAAAGNLQAAAKAYSSAVALDPREPILAYKLAKVLDKLGDRVAERAALTQAVAIDEHMAAAQNQLGYLDFQTGDIAAATQHFEAATAADPAFARAWINLAGIHLLGGHLQEAGAAVDHVLELQPGNADAQALAAKIKAMQAGR